MTKAQPPRNSQSYRRSMLESKQVTRSYAVVGAYRKTRERKAELRGEISN
jgi:hypothetical protein